MVAFVGFSGPAGSIGDLRTPPARFLAEALGEQGWSLEPIDELRSSPAGLISFNHHQEVLRRAHSVGIPRAHTMLALFEPPAVRPDQHRPALWRKYGLVVAPSLSWAEAARGVFLPWPQDLTLPNPRLLPQRGRRAVLMNANKWSATSDSLYGLRRQVIHGANRGAIDLDVYGEGWGRRPGQNMPHVVGAALNAARARQWPLRPELLRGVGVSANWLGIAADKLTTLAGYRVSVVIENSATYVSEKIFDAVRAGTVPVYVGPSLVDYGVPPAVAVQVPADAAAILDAVRELCAKDVRTMTEAGAMFLSAQETHETWGARQVASRLADILVETLSAPGSPRGGR